MKMVHETLKSGRLNTCQGFILSGCAVATEDADLFWIMIVSRRDGNVCGCDGNDLKMSKKEYQNREMLCSCDRVE